MCLGRDRDTIELSHAWRILDCFRVFRIMGFLFLLILDYGILAHLSDVVISFA